MLKRIKIRNFKRFELAEIELGSPVVFIGPNNSGKTTALQALAFWDLGLKRWLEKRGGKADPGKRPGVAINRRDFIAAPIPNAALLWRDLHTRDVRQENGKPSTKNVRIDLTVEGITSNQNWTCGFEFDYANEESFYCRPSRIDTAGVSERLPVPLGAITVKVAFLPPMSGLTDREFARQPAEVAYLIGQGRTAEVLRNLCYQVRQPDEGDGRSRWAELCRHMERLFGVKLQEPEIAPERAELTLAYRDVNGCILDISASGRGIQQTLLLLAYMSVNPNTVILLDEPDAHLEILRQREIYRLLCEIADTQNSQIVAASHSEVILNEAADKDVVVAFVGRPHRMDDRQSQVLKSLKEIGFDQYYQAETKSWVLYLEGATDLAILRAFAESISHPVSESLRDVFVHYVQNHPQKARDHFFGLREAKNDLAGFFLCDRLERGLPPGGTPLMQHMWSRREIENYLCQPETLISYAAGLAASGAPGPLFESQETNRLTEAMDAAIRDLVPPIALNDLSYPWWINTKISDDFLDPLFERFFTSIGHENLMRKSNYHRLAKHVSDIAAEVIEVLDSIQACAESATHHVP